ncbi:MAG TPA: hypothetical protein VG014_02905, partial [Acidimicrobiales bacterium]|nr:hypothetical protein [Acidimicrobiales bacterium]
TTLANTTIGATTINSTIPTVIGTPFTGGGPPARGGISWPVIVLAALSAAAGTLGVFLRRRERARHRAPELH